MKIRLFCAVAIALLAVAGCTKSSTGTSGNMKLTLFKPEDLTIRRGETMKVMVKIERTGFTQPVTVHFENFPAGVQLESEMSVGAGQSSVICSVHAAQDAALASGKEVRITAGGPPGLTTNENLTLTVKEAK
jgi:hypothetical protein